MSYRLVVFNALMLRSLVTNDDEEFHDELAAFRAAFQGRRFRMLLTDGIVSEYLVQSVQVPQFELQPTLNSLSNTGRVAYFDEHRLNRSNFQLIGFPQEHREFILDAIAARASYFITNRQEWLHLSNQTEGRYGLQIISPGGFVELES